MYHIMGDVHGIFLFSAEPPSGHGNANVIEISDPTPHLKDIIVQMLQINPDLQRTPQMLQVRDYRKEVLSRVM